MIPLYALWALPAVGWLMLCSAAARSKPFLWAVMVPVLGCALVSFANAVMSLGVDVGKLWYVVAYRGLASVFPATWVPLVESRIDRIHGPPTIFMDEGVRRTADWLDEATGAAPQKEAAAR